MKKKIIVLGLCSLMLCGCGKTIPTLTNGEEAVVKFENGDMISVDDLYKEIKSNYAMNVLIEMIDRKILEDKYKDEVDAAKEYAESNIKAYKEAYGEEQFLLLLQQSGFPSVEVYQNYVALNYLQNEAITDYAKAQIKDKEIDKYYKDNIYGDVLVDHILITSKATSDATDEEKEAAEAEAKDKINKIIEELKKSKDVKETFTKLASEQSEDESTKNDGGSLGYINNGTLSSKYDEIVKAAFELKDGEFSTSVITTELGYHVILREASKDKAPLEEVKDSIIETLSNKLLTDDATVAIKALQDLRKEYGMDIIDSDIQSQYATSIQNQLAQAQNSNSSN